MAGVGDILEHPQSTSVIVGSAANFSCTAVGHVFWEINGMQAATDPEREMFANNGIFVPPSTYATSTVIINATAANNGTTLRCFVEATTIVNITDLATLTIQGTYKLGSPK